jgi:predicted GIY-YIG superfamily endonuclease
VTFWVYILRCADDSYYTGHTDNLEKRIAEHHAGAISNCYTFKRRPLQLTFCQDFPTREEALTSEQQIKGWSRKKKEAMMRGDWAEVSRLAKSKATIQAKPFGFAQDSSVETRPESATTVRPELVEGQKLTPEFIEATCPPIHPSTARQARSSGRTDGEELDGGHKL